MATLLRRIQLPYETLEEANLAEIMSHKAGDNQMALDCKMLKAEAYFLMGETDSVISISENVSKRFSQCGDTIYSIIALKPAILGYINKGRIESAKKAMEVYETFLNNNQHRSLVSYMKDYNLLKAHYYLKCLRYDSAYYYYRQANANAKKMDERLNVYRGFSRYYINMRVADSALKYTDLYVSTDDSIYRTSVKENFAKMQALYNYERNQRKAEQAEHHLSELRYRFMVAAFVAIILLLLVVLIYIRHQNEKRRLEDRIRLLRGYAINEQLHDAPIAHQFRQLLKENPYKMPDLNDWKALSSLIDQEVPTFRTTLNGGSHTLTDFEYDVCMLIKIQIPASDIAKLKQCAPSYITQTRKNIFQNLFSKKGRADELDEYIMSLS
jgi:hypothetical protein